MSQQEIQEYIVAKTYKQKERTGLHVKRTAYSIIDPAYVLWINKEDIIRNLLYACKSALKHTADKADREVIETEILQLKRILNIVNPFIE